MPIIINTLHSMTSLLSPAARLGYVHYTVADLENQIAFYTKILGLQLHWRQDNKAGLGVGLVWYSLPKTKRRGISATQS